MMTFVSATTRKLMASQGTASSDPSALTVCVRPASGAGRRPIADPKPPARRRPQTRLAKKKITFPCAGFSDFIKPNIANHLTLGTMPYRRLPNT